MELIPFLLESRRHGYASAGERDETRLEDGGKRLRFRAPGWLYQDVYYGSNPFVGEELVLQDGAVVWSMNYYGLVLDETVPPGDVYQFLQQAMRLVGPARPYRGPDFHRDGDWEYRDASQGDPQQFLGEEQIFFQGRLVYRLYYHGGRVG